MYVCICICICMYIHTHIRHITLHYSTVQYSIVHVISPYMYTYVRTCLNTNIYINTHLHAYRHTYIRTYVHCHTWMERRLCSMRDHALSRTCFMGPEQARLVQGAGRTGSATKRLAWQGLRPRTKC